LSGSCLEKNSFEGFGHIDGEEATGSVTVVLSTLVHDPEIAMSLRLRIGDNAIQLPDLKRSLIAFVLDTDCKLGFRLGWLFHFLIQERKLDFHLPPTNAVRFIPVHLCSMDTTIQETNSSHALLVGATV
jgi:hypothetical protein